MYRFFYNHAALKDTLIVVIDPESRTARVEERNRIVALYDEGNKLIGLNIFHIEEVMRIKANGIIFVPDEKLLEVVNSILAKEGMEPLAPLSHSGYQVATVYETEEHPLDEKSQILKLKSGSSIFETVSRFPNVEVGSKVVVALPGTILHDGSLFRSAVIKNINNDVLIVSPAELRLEGSAEEAFILDDDPSFKDGDDFFLHP